MFDCASTHVEAMALVGGVGDMWAQKLSVHKEEQDVPKVPEHQLCPWPGKHVCLREPERGCAGAPLRVVPLGQSLCFPADCDQSTQGANEIWDFSMQDLVLRMLAFSLYRYLEK